MDSVVDNRQCFLRYAAMNTASDRHGSFGERIFLAHVAVSHSLPWVVHNVCIEYVAVPSETATGEPYTAVMPSERCAETSVGTEREETACQRGVDIAQRLFRDRAA